MKGFPPAAASGCTAPLQPTTLLRPGARRLRAAAFLHPAHRLLHAWYDGWVLHSARLREGLGDERGLR